MSGDVKYHSLEKRLWDRTIKTDECWLWQGYLRNGYGYIRDNYAMRGVHRVAYELQVGELLPGYDVHHKCQVRNCVRGDHLEQMPEGDHIAEENRIRYFNKHGKRKSYL